MKLTPFAFTLGLAQFVEHHRELIVASVFGFVYGLILGGAL